MEYKLGNIQGKARLVICLSLFVLVLVFMPQMGWAQILDPNFDPNVSGQGVFTIANQMDGRIIIGGAFTQIGGVTRNHIARLNANGTLDTNFNPIVDGFAVGSLAIQADGRIIIGGAFTQVNGMPRNGIARINADGTLDTNFNPNANSSVWSIAIQADGRIIIVGDFTSIGGVTRNRIARINADGTLDTTFNSSASGVVQAIAIQADGRIIIGGHFTTINGVIRNSIARLNSADGTLDTAFNPNADNRVHDIEIQADGRIIIGGEFTAIGGATRNRIARLNANGTLDTAFHPTVDGFPTAIAIQADGRIIIGGHFTTINGVTRNNIARLHANGTLDPYFNPNVNNHVQSISIQADRNIIVVGNFTQIGGVTRNRIARIIPAVLHTNFAQSSDTTLYAYENVDGKAGRPTVGWLSNYLGASGVAVFSFGNLNQGVKMTLGLNNFISSVSSKWYLLEARVMTDSPFLNDKSVNLFLFNGIPPNPFDVAAHAIPHNLSTTWSWMHIYLQSVGGVAQMYPQLIIQNNGLAGNIYVDTIRITQQAPPTTPTVFYEGGDWNRSDDINNYWAIEDGFDLPNRAALNVSNGILTINFNGLSPQGLKMTMSTTAGRTVTAPTNIGRAAGMSTNISNIGSLSDGLILLAAFGTNQSGGASIEELAASASYQRIPPGENGLYRLIYYPTQPHIYGQIMVKNSAAGIFYLSNTYLIVEPNIALLNKADYWELVRK